MWQAKYVASLLNTRGVQTEIVPLVSSGDIDMRPIDGTSQVGVFTKRIQVALLENEADIAVHSLKDLPTQAEPDLVVAAMPPRETVFDCLVSKRRWTIATLPQNATVGTGSRRRAAQLRHARPDLKVVPIRGNVQTRLSKLESGEFDAIVLAAAGLERLDMKDVPRVQLSLEEMLTAPGQGTLAVEVRSDSPELIEVVRQLDCSDTRATVTAERTLLAKLNGGCLAPIAAYSWIEDSRLQLKACVLSEDGATRIDEQADFHFVREEGVSGAIELATHIAEVLIKRGAKDLIVQSRQESKSSEESPGLPDEEGLSSDSSLIDSLIYGLSLPERTARSVSAVVGGIVNESTARLIPAAFRSSRSYKTFIQQSLDMLVHDVGGVKNENVDPTTAEESQLAQKAVGGLLDIAGAATLHLSPMTVLAVFNDIAYGSGYYLERLSDELKREGIIDENSSIDHASDLIAVLRDTSTQAADTMDTPPISVEGIRETVAKLTEEISKADPSKLLPQAEIERIWGEMEQTAKNEDVGLWDVSATMTMFAMNRVSLTTRGAFSTLSVAGSLFDEHIVSHYVGALDEIDEQGLYATLTGASAPYLEAVWKNFDEERETWTEELLTGRMIGSWWTGIRGWFASE